MRCFWTIIAAVFSQGVAAQSVVDLLPSRAVAPAPYARIMQVSLGPAQGPMSESIHGRLTRLVVVQQAIIYDHPIIRIESLVWGDEACCIRIASARSVDLNKAAQEGFDLPDARQAQVEQIRWLAPDSAEFKYGDRTCRLDKLNAKRVRLACRK